MNVQRIRTLALLAALLAAFAPWAAQADQVKLNVALAKPFLMAGKKQTTYLKVGLTGFVLENKDERTPVNVAIVIDKSGSMSGEKIRKAKEAALMAIDRLTRKDIVSVVAYNHAVEVLLPATKVADKAAIRAAISRALDQHISQLRKRIERDPKDPTIIRTVHGVGYRYDG